MGKKRSDRPHCEVKLDRLGIASWAKSGWKPPTIQGFETEYDHFVRGQQYRRARSLRSTSSDARISWQYDRKHGWLKRWRITINGADQTGITTKQLRRVIDKCRHFRFIIAELALHFPPEMGVDENFVRRHAIFGKSRRSRLGGKGQLRYGTRKSAKLVRCYAKRVVDAYRVEIELHSQLLRKHRIESMEDIPDISLIISPQQFRFVRIDWAALNRHLSVAFGDAAHDISKRARELSAGSIAKARRYLVKKGVANVHRFYRSLPINRLIQRQLSRWAMNFGRGLHGQG